MSALTGVAATLFLASRSTFLSSYVFFVFFKSIISPTQIKVMHASVYNHFFYNIPLPSSFFCELCINGGLGRDPLYKILFGSNILFRGAFLYIRKIF